MYTKITFSGGGAKGVTLIGAHKALEATNQLAQIDEVSGASAGAITAALVAFGISNKKLHQTAMTAQPEQFLGDAVQTMQARLREGAKAGVVPKVTKDGKPMLDSLKNNIRHAITDFFENHEGAEKKALMQAINNKSNTNPMLKAVLGIYEEAKKANGRITFGHLSILNQYKKEVFKKLKVNATSFPDGAPIVFDSQNEAHQNIEVASACRGSAALPIVLSPVSIYLNDGSEKLIVDGGYYDNLPTDDVSADERAKRLVFAFSEGAKLAKNPVKRALVKGQRNNQIIASDIAIKINQGIDGAYSKSFYIASVLNQQPLSFSEKFRLFKIIRKHVISQATDALQDKIKTGLEKGRLYKPGFFEKIKRNTMPQYGLGFKGYVTNANGEVNHYTNTQRKEVGYQKIRHQYPWQTIALSVGNIKTTDFKKAYAHQDVLVALGFLDTLNFLKDEQKQAEFLEYYLEILEKINTYQLTSTEACLINQVSALIDSDSLISEKLVNITNMCQQNLGSINAKCLGLAYQQLSENLNEDTVHRKIDEICRKKSCFTFNFNWFKGQKASTDTIAISHPWLYKTS